MRIFGCLYHEAWHGLAEGDGADGASGEDVKESDHGKKVERLEGVDKGGNLAPLEQKPSNVRMAHVSAALQISVVM